jgi:type IV secretory pathway VirB2 component (pilin)
MPTVILPSPTSPFPTAKEIEIMHAQYRSAIRHLPNPLLMAAAALVFPTVAMASGSGMPWEEPLQQILESVQGPVAKIVAVIIIITTGLALAFGETSGGFRKLIQIVFGLSIAFAASSFFLSFFSFGGGALV